MLKEHRKNLPEMPEVMEKLRELRQLIDRQIEVREFKKLPITPLTVEEFAQKYCEAEPVKKWFKLLVAARPDLKFGSYAESGEAQAALFSLPSADSPFGWVAVPSMLELIPGNQVNADLLKHPTKSSAYMIDSKKVLLLNRKLHVADLRDFMDRETKIYLQVANRWPETEEVWNNLFLGKNFFSPRPRALSLGEPRHSRTIETVLHELGHCLSIDLAIDPATENQKQMRALHADYLLDPQKAERELTVPVISAFQEIFHSERVASIIARILKNKLEKVGFLEKTEKFGHEDSLQTYDVSRARYILENFTADGEAEQLFASRWARSKKGVALSREILRDTDNFKSNFLQRLTDLGKPERVELPNAIRYAWKNQDDDGFYSVVVIRTYKNQFLFGSIKWEGPGWDLPWTAVEIGSFSGVWLTEGSEVKAPREIFQVAAGKEVSAYTEKLDRAWRLVDLVLTRIKPYTS